MFSRRHFLKAAGQGIALTAVGVRATPSASAAPLAQASPFALPTPIAQEQSAFLINGRTFTTAYEARTTLWEVIAVKLGLTGTNRSCNKASCGACSVLIDGVPFYSCHTLAMEAAGRKILTIEGVGDEKNLHPLQRIGHERVAADCGFCTAGWVVTAKGLLDTNRNPSEDQVKAALAGHICRCAAYPSIVSTVMDSAAVLRGENRPVVEPHSIVHIKQPMVRDFSTHGGHSAGDELIERPSGTSTKKWQGYAPENLKVIGRSMPPLEEVAIPRFTGKAEYASRVRFANMLHARFLTCPHPRARIRDIDTSVAENMPGVAHILTYKNAPAVRVKPDTTTTGPVVTTPNGNRLVPAALPRDMNLQGEVVAIVAAETEDLAEDAIAAIKVDYDVLPFVSTIKDVLAPGAPDLRGGKGNLIRTWESKAGDVERGFAEADIVKEFEYHFAGAVSVPMQPSGSVAKWDGDRLTIWGMGQGIYPVRNALATSLGIEPSKIRFINKWNGSTFGSGRLAAERFYPLMAHLAKVTGRPVKVMLPKDQELAQLLIKPETLTRFKVGAKKDGQIVALQHEILLSVGDVETGYHASGPGNATNQLELYTSGVPHWKSVWSAYKTNAPRPGPSRSYIQQETKWSWEAMMDEMAETLGLDPIEFRLKHITRPKAGDDRYPYDSFASVEVLTEGARVFGWDKRTAKAGAASGRFKRGMGLGMTQHHGGLMGYHEGEAAFPALAAAPDASVFGSEIEVGSDAMLNDAVRMPQNGVAVVGPGDGPMACGEFGPGRMAEPETIFQAIQAALAGGGRLGGKHVIVTAGPTAEPIDPVRVLTNRSSGKQGYAIAGALADLGARVTLVSGPTALPAPAGVTRVDVESAQEMLAACRAALPADAAVFVAAVADWRPDEAFGVKLKKSHDGPPTLRLVENPDILASLAAKGARRPKLVVGFAAETNDLIDNARAKLAHKGADWIVANDVSQDWIMGGDENEVHLVTKKGVDTWAKASKAEVARRLAGKIAEALS